MSEQNDLPSSNDGHKPVRPVKGAVFEKYLNICQASDYLKCSSSTLKYYALRKKILTYAVVGRDMVFKVTDLNNLHNKIIHALKTEVNPLDIEKFLDTLTFNSVDFDLFEFGKMFQAEFMHKGLIINTEINSKKMQDALSKYEKLFEPLTNALISKINEE